MENRISSNDSFEEPIEVGSPISRISPRSWRPRTASFSSTRPKSSSTRATGKHSRPSSSTSCNSTGSTASTYFARRKTWEQSISVIGVWYRGGFITSQFYNSVRLLLDGFESRKRTSTTYTIQLMISQFRTSSLELCGYTAGRKDFTILITISDSSDLK